MPNKFTYALLNIRIIVSHNSLAAGIAATPIQWLNNQPKEITGAQVVVLIALLYVSND